jgi:signal peptidase I
MNNPRRSREILKNVGINLLSEGKTIRIKAHGYSMYPAIKPGSIILIEPINLKGKPAAGEIIAIKREDGLVVHRLVKIIKKDGSELFIARGDSNSLPDNPVKIGRIAGRIIRAETSGENQQLSDIRINPKPEYFLNRLRVIWIISWGRIKRKIKK